MANKDERLGFRIEGDDQLSPALQKIDRRFLESSKKLKQFESESKKSFKRIRQEADKFSSSMGNIRTRSVTGFDEGNLGSTPVRQAREQQQAGGTGGRRVSGRMFSSGIKALRGNAAGFLSMGAQIGGVGLAFGAAGAAVLGFGSHIAELTEKMHKNKAIMQATFSGTPQEIEGLTIKATALSKVFGDDYNATVSAASQISRQFGISSSEAFALLKKGALAGANASGDMLQQLEQFGTEMGKLGLTASEQLALIGQAAKFGGTETLVAGLQGFKEELSDFGTGTVKLLNNAFGKDFTAKFRKNVQSGKVGMQEALATVSKAFNKTTLSGKELDEAMQDTFGDAASQLGIGAIKNLQTLNLSLDDAVSKNAKFNEGLKEQMSLDEQLAESQARMAKSFEGFSKGLAGLWTNIKIGFNNAISSMAEFAKSNEFFKSQFISPFFTGAEKMAKEVIGTAQQYKDAFNKLADTKGEAAALKQIEANLGGLNPQVKKLLLEEIKKTRTRPEASIENLTESTGGKDGKGGKGFFDTNTNGKKSLEQSGSNIITGGKETRNVTVTIDKMVGVEEQNINQSEQMQISLKDIEKMMLDLLTRTIQGAELNLAK